MKRHRNLWLAAVGCALFLVGFGNAWAQATRTWVSGVGDDANPCSRTAPCKTFAGAISKTAAGGVINALDPGGYGVVTITKAITIDMGDLTGGILSAGTNGVIVNAAATDEVVLRGVSIDGVGTGLNGIRFLAGKSLTLEHCVIANGTQKGLDVQPTTADAALILRDTAIRGFSNAATGGAISIAPAVGGSVIATLDNVSLSRNLFGVQVNTRSALTVRNSVVSNNDSFAFKVVASGGSAVLSLENTLVTNNGGAGVFVQGAGGVATLSRSTFLSNGSGMSTLVGGLIQTFGDNHNNGSGAPNQPITASQ